MKKLAELKQQLEEKRSLGLSLAEEGKLDEVEKVTEEVRSLSKQIKAIEELQIEEKRGVEVEVEERKVDKTIEERTAFGKLLQGKATVEERALVGSSVSADGGYLVPKDVKNDINELKRQYKSAKEIVGVVPVSTESGSFVQEDLSSMTDLVNFDETTSGLTEQQPKFKNVEFKVLNYGAVTPIARTFLQDEAANFLSYLNKQFAIKAVRTENKKIFEELKRGKTAKAITDIKSLKKVVNIDLDPTIASMAVIAVNQDAFNYLDEMQDTTGRPLLQPNPSNATQKMLFGLPVHVFSNAELPTTGTTTKKAPMFIGALTEGVKFFDRGAYEVRMSEEAGFTKNQVVARVIERFDVKQADSDAYVFAEVTLA